MTSVPTSPRSILRGQAGAGARPLVSGELIEREIIDRTEELHAEAVARGYEEGHAQARAEAQAALAVELEQRKQALQSTLDALQHAAANAEEAWAEQVALLQQEATTLAYEIVEALLERELEVATNPGRDALIRALSLNNDEGLATARLYPEDLALIGEDLDLGRAIKLVGDESVGRGGALIELGSVVLDARVGPALKRLRAALGLLGELS